jgi:cytochrome b561
MHGTRASRYSKVAIILHWLIAVAILLNIPLAWWMTEMVSDPSQQARVFAAYQLHKSIGLTVLLLTLVRLAWRLVNRPPPLPETMVVWERGLARITHVLLYLLMILIPLAGWTYVSAGWNSRMDAPFAIPTLWFGLFQWPHIPGLQEAALSTRAETAEVAIEAHEWLGKLALFLVVLHVAAALKHHWIDRDDVLARMLPLVRSSGSKA